MTQRSRWSVCGWLLPILVVTLLGAPRALTDDSQTSAGEGYVGAETCAACHEEVVANFSKTAHATAPGWHLETGCESCHGAGQAHADGDESAITNLGALLPREASEVCIACHDQTKREFRSRHAVHDLADVGCTDCHNSHSTADNMLVASGTDLCAGCHGSVVSEFEMARSHPLDKDGQACQSCHNPHTDNSLRNSKGLGNNTCDSCHFEKAGPFVYDHDVSLIDDCASCHRVHGSTNRHLLTHSIQINLCYQCHSAEATPTFHNAGNFLTEKCTACHTAIHGSNTNAAFLEE